MKIYVIIIIVLIFNCCNKASDSIRITGDLYFAPLNFTYYNQPDSIKEIYETYFDTLNLETAGSGERDLYKTYQLLKTRKLIDKPSIILLMNQDSTIRIFLDQSNYNKIKVYKRANLQRNNKKIVINCESNLISQGIYYCNNLLSINLIDGQTYRREGKLKIEDYE